MAIQFQRMALVGGLAVLTVGCAMSFGQNSDVNIGIHVNSHTTAADVGLPTYPGATPYKDPDNKGNDTSADVGFAFGNFRFDVRAMGFVTPDPPERVLAFYRKPLSQYGEVLECDHGKPVGKLTITNTGLTCSDNHGGHVQVNGSANSSEDHELRAGTPHKFRLVSIDNAQDGKTRFGLVYLELPRDKDAKPE